MGEFGEQNGVVLEEPNSTVLVGSSSSSSLNEEVWARAEEATEGIIRQVQPTVVSEERRKDVTDYVQRLLKFNLGCEVFSFGSVPLKTYLPDGDIDLTAFCSFNMEESFAAEVHSVLEREDRNLHPEFVVKDVQYICAEVKLVKCLVQNIVVDISFNQIGGLCALCFLEEVDRLIGKDHLFKRSIILIKAWCYYESRILGAHHGLISTYALETLVLYIFHLFHSSLTGPLAVLYKFLDYFSKFDWENYCVSLSGPVNLKSLPKIVAERPENGGSELLLSDDFMRECVYKFCVPCKGGDTNSRTFMRKHFNIVDPLKANNNLGRSVSKGNFFRIRSAFTYGARKLGRILSQPQNEITEEIQRFFTNTLDRHGQGHRPDVEDMMVTSGYNDSFAPNIESVYPNDSRNEVGIVPEETRHGLFSNSNSNPVKDRLSGDAVELAACGFENLVITSPLMDEKTKLPLDDTSGSSHHRLSNGKLENGCSHENAPSLNSNSVSPKMLPDLSGDVVSHLESLRYGRWWYGCDQFLATFKPVHVGPPLFHRNNRWDSNGRSMHFRRDMVPCVNGVIPRPPPFFPPPVVAGAGFVDEVPKPRGTGTYFPITNHNSYSDRPSVGRGRKQGQSKSPWTNGHTPTPFPNKNPTGVGKPRCPDSYGTLPKGKGFKEVNGVVPLCEKGEKFVPLHEGESNMSSPDPTSPPESVDGELVFVKDGRVGVKSYQLVDEEDFPPLSA